MPSGLNSRVKELGALAAPIAGVQLAQVALTTTDTVMMGLLGVWALAAGGLAIVLFNQVRTMCVGLVTAVGNQVATVVGRGEKEQLTQEQTSHEVRQVVRASLVVATAVGALGAVVLVGLGYALAWLGQDARVLAGARPMMIALAPGLIPLLWLNALRQFAVGMRRPKALLGVMVAAVGVNAALNLAFIHGWAGLPRLGLTGIGVATTGVQVFSVAAFWVILRRDPELSPLLSLREEGFAGQAVKEILRLGVPIALTYGSEAGLFSVSALVIGTFGPGALAAHNAVNQLTYIVFQVAIGLSHGSSVLVSRSVGRSEPHEAAQVAKTALTVSASFVALVAVVYAVAPGMVLWPFLRPDDGAGWAVARVLLLVAIVQQFFDAAQNIAVGLLRGLGDTKSGFTITLFGYWAVGLPVALGFGLGLGWGAPGVWLGLSAGLACCAALLLRVYRRGLARLEPA